ncbi:zinc-binding alcohol dehydrogenase family protein [Teredinibacter turnerae]|uniref:zinc-binding alcohol dehydrogenase family protein n=1 Tax=Teredinibacter turnerae TaxID=2426 RepID=UPI0030D24557
MKAIGYTACLPITDEAALQDIELPKPDVSGRDLLIKIDAISVNPVDYKIRKNVAAEEGSYKVLGWDAVGTVLEKGPDAELFNVGDRVFYAGDLTRPGTNAEYQLVDERIVGNQPKNVSNSEAAALPLTAITAWEMLFEHLAIKQASEQGKASANDVLLIVGAAGGVGSILIQLAKRLTGATVIATASRDATQTWVKELGADYVVDHSKPLVDQINALDIAPVTHVASLTNTGDYIDSYIELLKPMGKIAVIDDPATLDVTKLKRKSLSLHWEFMFTRSMFATDDMIEQHKLLNQVSALVDEGTIKTTQANHMGTINAANLRKAHELLEGGRSVGKITLEGF